MRVALFAALIGIIHWRHERFLAGERAAGLASVPLARVQEVFPNATRIGPSESHGGREVLDANEQPLGYVIQTAPASDTFLGFSGPTNWLVGFDLHDHVVGATILSSGDTRDHVELIRRDARFLASFQGLSAEKAAMRPVDAVSGATLTSLAMLQGLRARLGRPDESLKFPAPPTLAAARLLFPDAEHIEPEHVTPAIWRVRGAGEAELGLLVRSSPAADSIVGYQGPSESWIGVSSAGRVTGVAIGPSFDNEPYVGYVRGDEYFRHLFDGKSIDELSRLDVKEAGIEGVSGATMTSMAVARGIVAAAKYAETARERRSVEESSRKSLRLRNVTTVAIVVVGIVMSMTRLRGVTWFRVAYQAIAIGYLGLVNGDLLSSALFVGWAQNGVPLPSAAGVALLSAAALTLPIFFGANTYCAHLCPHGALQQWVPKHIRLKREPPRWLAACLSAIRPALLGWIVFVALTRTGGSLADIEPFDAYAWRAAAWPTVTVAVAGLVASVLWPMAYCRHGCPTGAVLSYLRRHSRNSVLSRADLIAAGLLLLAAALAFCG